MTTDLEDKDRVIRELQTALIADDVRLLEDTALSENLHFSAVLRDGRRYFVKVYSSEEKYHAERTGLNLLAESHVPTSLPQRADITGGIPWVAFAWLPMEPTAFSRETALKYGDLMAKVHRVRPSGNLSSSPEPLQLVDERLEKLSALGDVQPRLIALWRAESPGLRRDLAGYVSDPVLLQNDFGERNVFRRQDTGNLIIIDFEHVTIGDSHWELGKIWDREFRRDAQACDDCIRSYRERRGIPQGAWPDMGMLWLIRFVATMGIFTYCQRVDDPEFYQHGLEKLGILETEGRGDAPRGNSRDASHGQRD
jgi:hypothetical protein